MGGGRIVRDRLWFYLTYRESYAENTVPGMFFNKNAGNPTKWLVDFDPADPAFSDTRVRNDIGAPDVAGIAAQQDQLHELGAVQLEQQNGRRIRDADA